MLAELLLPDQNVLTLKEVVQENDVLVVTAETKTKEANCPDCGRCSLRVHGRYHRQIADLPCTCYSLLIDLEVRRFKCTNNKCIRRTFTERLPDVVRHYGRRTERLRDNQHHVALHAGGELGHRLIKPLNLTTSADTLLRLVRDGEEQEIRPPRVVGIDDWAFRKGQSYGTIIIDLERQKPIDLLPDRTAGTVSEWLKQYPSIEIISRDRATEYAKAATEGAPQAIQVADRWHLLKNLRDATERFLGRHSRYLKATIPIIEDPPENEDDEVEMVPLPPAGQDSLKRRERRLALFEKVRKMHQEGCSIREIARQLEISRQLARKFAYADEFPEQAQRRRRKSKLDPYVDYLEARVETGCYSGTTLFREIKRLGFTGARTLVARWLRQKRYGPEGKAPKKSTQHRPWAVARTTWLFVLTA